VQRLSESMKQYSGYRNLFVGSLQINVPNTFHEMKGAN